MKLSIFASEKICILHGQVYVMVGQVHPSQIGHHEKMSV